MDKIDKFVNSNWFGVFLSIIAIIIGLIGIYGLQIDNPHIMFIPFITFAPILIILGIITISVAVYRITKLKKKAIEDEKNIC